MSVIQRPRANFRGVFTTNVPTANNDKVSYTLDEPDIEVVNPNNLTDAQYRVWMMQTKTVQNTRWLNSYFNYFGDAGLNFQAASSAGMPYVSTVMQTSVLPGGQTLSQGQDMFLSGRVELRGDLFFDKPGSAKMVDLDPIGIYGTQIFSGEVRVVIYAPEGQEIVLLSGKDPTRAYIRNMYIDRNITPISATLPPGAWMGGAVWQLGLPLKGLTFNKNYLAPSPNQSPTLVALNQAAQAGQGLLVRFAMYYTLDGLDEGALADQFQASGYKKPIVNPATGMLVGSVGAWNQNEPASMPVERLIYPVMPITRPTSNYAFNVAMREKSPAVKIAASGTNNPPPPMPPYYLGPAGVIVDTNQKTVVLDLVTTIPETSIISSPPNPATDLQKANYGNLTLTILSNGVEQTVATITPTQYNRASYEAGGGILEFSYPPALASALTDPQGLFRLYAQALGPQPPQPAMQEIDYGYILTDDQCLYLTQGKTLTYKVQAFYKGQPVRNQLIPITTSQYQFVSGPDQPNQLAPKVFQPLDNTPGKLFVVSLPPNSAQAKADPATPSPINPTQYYQTDANGMVTLKVKGLQTGTAMLRYQMLRDNFDPNMGGANRYLYFGFTFYNAFRVMPNDNYDNIPDSQITWDFVYKEVIQYYYLLYPGMFARLGFQQESVAKNFAGMIRRMVDKRNWESTSYMPVSRDLSDGKRKLLQRWCALNE